MLIGNPDGSTEKLRHYGTKCDQHLSRVRLSHRLALDGSRIDVPKVQAGINELARASFDEVQPDRRELKLRSALHEVHLVALKSDFELYLNRVVTVDRAFRFARLQGFW
jgi:hypothetical protein